MKKIFTILMVIFSLASAEYAQGSDWNFLKMSQSEKNISIEKNLNYLIQHNAFSNENKNQLQTSFEPYRRDENSKQNIKSAKQGIVFHEDFDLGIKYNEMYTLIMEYYSIKYRNNPDIKYLYDGFGNLMAVEIIIGTEFSYPYYTCKYSNNGALNSVSYFDTNKDEYIYDSSQSLTGVKVKGVLYNRKGTRLDPRVQNPVIKRVMPIKR